MDKLISANELINLVEESRNNNPHKDNKIKSNHIYEHDHFINMIMNMPVIFYKENVLEDLEALAEMESRNMNDEAAMAYTHAIGIVEKGGIE